MISVVVNRLAELNLYEFKKGGISKPVLQALIFRLAGLGCVFILQVVLARMMGPAFYGDYTVIITTVNLLLVVSMFGFDSSMLRFLPSFISKGDNASANGFVKFSYRVITIVSIICSISLFIFLIAKSKKFNISFSEGLFWGMLLIPFLAFLHQGSAVLRALQRFKLSLLPVYFLLPVSIGITCFYYYNGHHKLTVDAAMLINLICTLVISIYINRKAGKILKENVAETTNSYAPTKWLSVSGVLFLTTGLELLLRQSDILMVSHFLGNTQAGYYAVAARLAMLTALGLSVTDFVFMPKISTLFESRQLGKLQQMVRNASLQSMSITLPIVFILFVAGKGLLGLFGTQFGNSYLPLVILLCGQIVNTFTGMVGGLMTMTGHQKTFLFFYAIAFAVQFVLNLLLIPRLGITGAAIGTSLSMILLNLAAYSFVKRRLKIKASIF